MADLLPQLFAGLQWVLPHHLLSALMFRVARIQWSPLKRLLIHGFVRRFSLNMAEALEPDPDRYAHWNDLFTRALRPEARPLAPVPQLLAPVDGVLSQFGTIAGDQLYQAKGMTYDLVGLLGGREDWAAQFSGGQYATFYLSPRDYHRVHMPVDGVLQAMLPVPGRLFSVNPITVARIPRLFNRNERLICLFEGTQGPFALILVGAIFVGSMETVWAGRVIPPSGPPRVQRPSGRIRLARGEEMGRFNLGSTVILLFPPDLRWDSSLRPGMPVRMGQGLGTC